MNLPNLWFKHIKDQDDQKKFKDTVINALNGDPTLNRLRDIVDEQIQQIERPQYDFNDYENPSWAYKQAFINGQTAALLEIRKLLDHE